MAAGKSKVSSGTYNCLFYVQMRRPIRSCPTSGGKKIRPKLAEKTASLGRAVNG